jgi:hypothetical protein
VVTEFVDLCKLQTFLGMLTLKCSDARALSWTYGRDRLRKRNDQNGDSQFTLPDSLISSKPRVHCEFVICIPIHRFKSGLCYLKDLGLGT